MFKRRIKQTILDKVRNWIWPKLGLVRTFFYHRQRIIRIPDTPYKIAAGIAIGVGVSFTPFIGFHILFGLIICFFLRANYVATAIGTVVGNPWTFPFIWVFIYNTGMKILGLPNEGYFMEKIDNNLLLSQPLEMISLVLWPMIIGAIPISVFVGWITYFPVISVIRHYRTLQQERISFRKKNLLETSERAKKRDSEGVKNE